MRLACLCEHDLAMSVPAIAQLASRRVGAVESIIQRDVKSRTLGKMGPALTEVFSLGEKSIILWKSIFKGKRFEGDSKGLRSGIYHQRLYPVVTKVADKAFE